MSFFGWRGNKGSLLTGIQPLNNNEVNCTVIKDRDWQGFGLPYDKLIYKPMNPAPEPDMKFSSGKYIFKYEGDLEYISLDTLIASQLHFSQALTNIKDAIHPDQQLEIKVKTLPKGSFQIELFVIVGFIDHILRPEVVAYAADLFSMFGGISHIIPFLKGKKPVKTIESGDNVTLINGDGNSITINNNVFHVYNNNPEISKEISETIRPIIEDAEITGIRVIDERTSEDILEIPREDFSLYLPYPETGSEKQRTGLRSKVDLVIYKVVFDKGRKKWQFYFDRQIISAPIHDDKFLAKLDQGEAFAKGDVLVCDLQIDDEYDEGLGVFRPKQYRVLRVYQHKPKGTSTQADLFQPGEADQS